MRKLLPVLACSALVAAGAYGVSLQTAYDQAGPGEGYDKLLELNPNVTYTGGCNALVGKKSCIRGNGALVNLKNKSIQGGANGTELTIEGCCLINGGPDGAINMMNGGDVIVDGNTITKGNGLAAVRVWEAASGTIKNNIIWGNAEFGIAKHENAAKLTVLYNDVANNGKGNYGEWCPD